MGGGRLQKEMIKIDSWIVRGLNDPCKQMEARKTIFKEFVPYGLCWNQGKKILSSTVKNCLPANWDFFHNVSNGVVTIIVGHMNINLNCPKLFTVHLLHVKYYFLFKYLKYIEENINTFYGSFCKYFCHTYFHLHFCLLLWYVLMHESLFFKNLAFYEY